MENEPKKKSFKLDTSPESLKSGLSALAVLVIIKLFGGGLIVGALAGGAVYASFYYAGWKKVVGLVIAGCLAILGIYLSANPVIEQQNAGNQLISGEVRSNFVSAAIKSCITTQTGSPENKDISADGIAKYCTCTANKTADLLTYDDVREGDTTGIIPPIIQQNMEALSSSCIDEVFGNAQ